MARARGFTLIELMVVVAIVAVLAAIALPSYGRYAFRSRRVDGQELLLRIANAQERYYSTYNKYGALTDIGYESPAKSEKGYYSVTLPASNSSTFIATAAPVGVQAGDACGSLSIDSTGNKTPDQDDAEHNTNGRCW